MNLRFVVFGLTISSSWGNGHATLWRGLARELNALGHRVTFLEHDLPYYASHRDLLDPEYCRLVLYPTWEGIRARAQKELDEADVGIVTSYCPDAVEASTLMFDSKAPLKLFYDLDTPITLASVETTGACPYLGIDGLKEFDFVLSFTGGRALDELRTKLGARLALPLFGWADPHVHRPVPKLNEYAGLLSYLGTHSEDRRAVLEDLLCEPARRLPDDRFILAGSMYPPDFRLPANVTYVGHVAPGRHGAFFSSSKFTLNITRRAMREYGFCPSGRLFEAAASGATIISDDWLGLHTFFEPQREIVTATCAYDVLRALELPEHARRQLGKAARLRVLNEHTAEARARQLLTYLFAYSAGTPRLDRTDPEVELPQRTNQPTFTSVSPRVHDEV